MHWKGARHWSKHFTCTDLLNTDNNFIRWKFIIPFYRWGNRVSRLFTVCPCSSLRWRWVSGRSYREELEFSASFMGCSGGVVMGLLQWEDLLCMTCGLNDAARVSGLALWALGSGTGCSFCLALFPPFTTGTFTHPSLAPEAGLGSPRPTLHSHSPHSLCLILWSYPEALQDKDPGLFCCHHCPQHKAWLTALGQCVLDGCRVGKEWQNITSWPGSNIQHLPLHLSNLFLQIRCSVWRC